MNQYRWDSGKIKRISTGKISRPIVGDVQVAPLSRSHEARSGLYAFARIPFTNNVTNVTNDGDQWHVEKSSTILIARAGIASGPTEHSIF